MQRERIIACLMASACALGISGQAEAVSICLDPGHGGSDPGAVGCNLQEAERTLYTCNLLKPLLEKAGYTVYMTRTSNVSVGLSARASYANSKGVTTFASIHNNAYNGSATGIETYCYTNNLSKNSGTQAKNIQNEMVKVWPLTNRGAKEANFAVVRETNMPATLSELAFIDNCSKDAPYLASASHQLNAARAHCRGIVAKWGGTASACEGSASGGGDTPSTSTGKVMAGTFENTLDPATRTWLGGVKYTIGSQSQTTGTAENSFVTFTLNTCSSFTATASKSGYTTASRSDCGAVTAGNTTWCSIALVKSTPEPPANGKAEGAVKNAATSANVAGAKVTVKNGASVTYNGTSNWSFSLQPGDYQIIATADGYDDGEITCHVESNKTSDCTITIIPQKGKLTGTVTDGTSSIAATVTVGTQTVAYNGTDKWVVMVDAGTHVVSAKADGYVASTQSCTVAEGKTSECNIVLQKEAPKLGQLSCVIRDKASNDPISGSLAVGEQTGVYTGDTPFIFNLTGGTHTVTASAEGYISGSVEYEVVPEQSTDCVVKLSPKAGTLVGSLVDALTGEAIGEEHEAQVKVVGQDMEIEVGADGSWTVDNLPAGTYSIEVVADGYQPITSSCTVLPGNVESPCEIRLVGVDTPVGHMRGIVYDSRSRSLLIPATVQIQGFAPAEYPGTGKWLLENLPAGVCSVSATSKGYYSATKSCKVYEGETSNCDLALANIETQWEVESSEPEVSVQELSDSCSAIPQRDSRVPFGFLAMFAGALAALGWRRRRGQLDH